MRAILSCSCCIVIIAWTLVEARTTTLSSPDLQLEYKQISEVLENGAKKLQEYKEQLTNKLKALLHALQQKYSNFIESCKLDGINISKEVQENINNILLKQYDKALNATLTYPTKLEEEHQKLRNLLKETSAEHIDKIHKQIIEDTETILNKAKKNVDEAEVAIKKVWPVDRHYSFS